MDPLSRKTVGRSVGFLFGTQIRYRWHHLFKVSGRGRFCCNIFLPFPEGISHSIPDQQTNYSELFLYFLRRNRVCNFIGNLFHFSPYQDFGFFYICGIHRQDTWYKNT